MRVGVFEGDGEAYRILTVTDATGAQITVVGGLLHDVAAGAAVAVYEAAVVDATLVAGYAKEITLTGFTSGKEMQVGQWITFGTGASSHSYTVIATDNSTATESAVLLDRPLASGITATNACYPGPAGGMNLAFTRDAIALVSRPLVTVPSSRGYL